MTSLATAAAVLLASPAFARAGLDEGDSLPVLTLSDWQGQPYTLGDKEHPRVVVVEFWASWCAPCREALPAMAALARAHPGELEIVAINVDSSAQQAEEFIATHLLDPSPGLVLLRDPEGAALAEFGASGMPALFVARDGRVRLAVGGFSQEKRAQVETLVRSLIGNADTAFDRSAPLNVTLTGPPLVFRQRPRHCWRTRT